MAESGPERARDFVRWQKAVIADVDRQVPAKDLARAIDGRLSNLSSAFTAYPELAESARRRAEQFGLLPELVVNVLSVYPEIPARFLFSDDIAAPTQTGVDLLARALTEVISDKHREGLVKCLKIWAIVQVGTFRTSDLKMIDILQKYPNDPATMAIADSMICSSWGALRGLDLHENPQRYDQSLHWARQFWDFSSIFTGCIRSKSLEERDKMAPMNESAVADGSTTEGGYSDEPADKQQLAMDLASSFVEAIETAPQQLHTPARQEVVSGLVMRAAREVIAILGCRDLWCFEFGAHVGRTLVEVRINIEWMALQGESIYETFQEYGKGKAKLNARIAEELNDKFKTPAVRESIDALAALGHNDSGIDLRVVDTRDNFAGVSLRRMAEEVGLLDYYRHAYSVASGVTHCEWWSVELHAMEKCRNILHRGHLIPKLSLPTGADVPLADSWVENLYALMRRCLELLGTDRGSVESAFAWMNADRVEDLGAN